MGHRSSSGTSEESTAAEAEEMEKDFEQAFQAQGDVQTGEERIIQSKDGQLVANIISTMSREMGIMLDDYKTYIISNVLTDLNEQLADEETYKIKQQDFLKKRGKKIPDYDVAHSEFLLLLSLSYILITIQTMTPPPNTKKTYPGCVKSFSGYPMEGEGDNSGLEYIVCVAKKIASSTKPWNAIKRSKTTSIMKKIKKKLDKIIKKKVITEKFSTAQKFFETYKKEFIPVSHDIKKWNTFLPPLQDYTAEAVSAVGTGYKEGLLAEIKRGSFKQYKDIAMLQGKIFYFSLSFVSRIQRIVKNKSTLLKSGNDEDFLENACCSTTDNNVLKYFIKEDRSIIEDNDHIAEIDQLLKDIKNSGKGVSVIYDKDTKLQYPIIPKQFSEEVIFLSFIFFILHLLPKIVST